MEDVSGPDAEVARHACRRLSLVQADEAAAAGLSATAVKHRVRTGRWQRKRRRVYGIAGVRPTFEQEVEAARLSHGPDALITGPTAARIWDMPGPHDVDGIHVLTLTPGKLGGPASSPGGAR